MGRFSAHRFYNGKGIDPMRLSNSLIGFCAIVFGLAVMMYTRGFPAQPDGLPGPEFFPNVLAGLFIVAGIGLALGSIRRGERILHAQWVGLGAAAVVNILLVLGIIVTYMLVADDVGFLLTSLILMAFLMKWLGTSWQWTILMSATVTMGIYLLFAKILMVPLPWGLWGF